MLRDHDPTIGTGVYYYASLADFEAELEKLEQKARGYRRALERFRNQS